jgi:trimeric autotransporter adhesin
MVTMFGGVEASAAQSNWSVSTQVSFPDVSWSSHNMYVVSAPYTAPDQYAGGYWGPDPIGPGNDTIFGGTGNSLYVLSNGNNWLDAGEVLFERITFESANDLDWRIAA